ncbi:MAG: hypothetical protein IKM15_00970 [Peptococcaceae bacterium]|nr:hypothetical protein [Peptococcaceae bacterium]
MRVLSAVVAISMLLCMSVVTFADSVTASVTTYDAATGTVEVKTTVAAGADEQVAFLVEKEGQQTPVWIDQQTADGTGTATSTFTALRTDIEGAKVRVGTTSTPSTEPSSIEWGSYKVTWTVTGTTESKVIAYVGDDYYDEEDNEAAVGFNVGKITFYFSPAPGETLSTINGENVFVGKGVSYNITGNTNFNFVFTTKTIKEDDPTSDKINEALPVASVNSEAGIALFDGESASVAAKAENATEYGIIVATNKKALDNLTKADIDALPNGEQITNEANATNIIKLPALGSNGEGLFVIQIEDKQQKFFAGSQYWAAVYAVNDNGADLTDAFELN